MNLDIIGIVIIIIIIVMPHEWIDDDGMIVMKGMIYPPVILTENLDHLQQDQSDGKKN